MKRIVSIQDISDIGKCSLTAALPVISAMGVECAVLPTAVLSAHSQFEGFTFRNLTEEMTAGSRSDTRRRRCSPAVSRTVRGCVCIFCVSRTS